MTAAFEYRCIVADPPWNERGGGKCKRGADRHYPLLKTPDIARVMMDAPCWRPADNCHLWLWVTNNFLQDGLAVMESLGFRYVTNMAWVKMRKPSNAPGMAPLLQIGLGQYLRGAHELCLFGTRGETVLPAIAAASVLFAERTEHSVKPASAYELIEKQSLGPRLEMFARSSRPGWDGWGNELAVLEASHG